ncbi:hypothetical protein [Colwellia sp. TT2012]|uniref:hypothetical protein n=1 Tax=Colwellia sp. TT2012 TaxID=1720342 RepID=UPI00070948D9|nr:hypothetical protein [Colwellia sp. TT2012]
MTMNKLPSTFILITAFICCLLLSGCSNTVPLEQLENKQLLQSLYQVNQKKWLVASSRENDLFKRYNLKVLASIEWKKRSDAQTYSFKNITLVGDDDKYTINLLNPEFSQTMACGWYCEYLDQPITQAMTLRYTMLDKIYEKEKQQLHNFYSSINRLNNNLAKLPEDKLILLPNIIKELKNKPEVFDSLADLMGFLNNYFDEVDFKNISLGKDIISTREIIVNNAMLDPEYDLQHRFSEPQTLQQLLGIPPLEPRPVEISNDIKISVESRWLIQQKLPIYNDQFVCSYKENYFGYITNIEQNKITVALKGQVKEFLDGLLLNMENGLLFNKNQDISFITLEKNKIFNKTGLAPCSLLGFEEV